MPRQNKVRYIETPEDYRDYLADRGLYEALKSREEIERTHSIPKLIRMWVDHLKETENGEV